MSTQLFNDNHIPFAIRERDGEVVSVQEVPNGNGCGCICPSCETPMVARQGDINVWHFAHQTRSGSEKTRSGCDYSFYVSLRLMIRQLAKRRMQLALPSLELIVVHYEAGEIVPYEKEVLVTEARSLWLENVATQSDFCGVSVDVLGEVAGVPLAVYVTYPGREVPERLKQVQGLRAGVISIDLRQINSYLYENHRHQRAYSETVNSYLSNCVEGKAWIYHPRSKVKVAEAKKELKNKAQGETNGPVFRPEAYYDEVEAIVKSSKLTKDFSEKQYWCTCCRVSTRWNPDQGLCCPNCGSSLYLTSMN